jgi:hypothetical protein
MAGGVRLCDGHRTIMPGCCRGTEDGREQIQVLVRCSGWLGQDPAPYAKAKLKFGYSDLIRSTI